jgi:hypothetical protein
MNSSVCFCALSKIETIEGFYYISVWMSSKKNMNSFSSDGACRHWRPSIRDWAAGIIAFFLPSTYNEERNE